MKERIPQMKKFEEKDDEKKFNKNNDIRSNRTRYGVSVFY